MSWHYLQEEGEASWEGGCLDGVPSVLLNLLPTPGRSCSLDSETDTLIRSRSGTMCAPSMGDRGAGQLMLFQAVSRAKTSAPPVKVQGSKAHDLDSGVKWPGSLAKYDHGSRSWRTAQCSLLGGLESYSETWPRWGMMRGGECWALDTLGHRIDATESGYSPGWPTPKHHEDRAECYTRETSYRHWKEGRQVALSQVVRDQRMWPTPTVQDSKNTGGPSQHRRNTVPLNAVVQTWPTPVVGGMRGGSGAHKKFQKLVDSGKITAEEARIMNQAKLKNHRETVEPSRMWPTPLKSDSATRRKSERWAGTDLVSQVTEHEENSGNEQPRSGGKLNPDWVAWLMGWPIGWTDLKPLETVKFRQWLRLHGIRSEASDDMDAREVRGEGAV